VVQTSEIDVEQKTDKIAIIEMADAIVDPRTMMVCTRVERLQARR
jgi:hypothetical protein